MAPAAAGKKGGQIPLGARIVAVADMFDALTSERCYKAAWTNQRAFEVLRRLAGDKPDRDCVQALLDSTEEIQNIQGLSKEDYVWLGSFLHVLQVSRCCVVPLLAGQPMA